MATTVEDLIKYNNGALVVLRQALERLKELREEGPPPSELNRILAQINTTEADITTAKMINAHLQAATTVVQPIPQDEEQQLGDLAESLNKTIMANTFVGAALAFIQSAVGDAEEIHQTTLRHT